MTAQPPMIPLVFAGAAVKTTWGLAPALSIWVLLAFTTPPTGPPRLPPALVKLTVDCTALPRVRLAKVSTELEPVLMADALSLLSMTLAPPLMVSGPSVCVSAVWPARKDKVPPVSDSAPLPMRDPDTMPMPLLSRVI